MLRLYIFIAVYVKTCASESLPNPDAGCAIIKPFNPEINEINSQFAFVVDASKSMETYRLKLQDNFKSMLDNVKLKFKAMNNTKTIGFKLVSLTNGCPNLHVENNQRGFSDNTSLLHISYPKIKTAEDAPSGQENANAASHAAAQQFEWQFADCIPGKRRCVFHYIVLFTGSGSLYNSSTCNGKRSASYDQTYDALHIAGKLFRIIGFFPNDNLVKTYAEISKTLDVRYCGYSFSNNPENVLNFSQLLLDCITQDVQRANTAYEGPCFWEDPQGFITLGL